MILFICTGNTCRSPLAAALARGLGEAAQSAGLCAVPGAPATREACRAAMRRGADLSGHRARPVTQELLDGADRIYVMTAGHYRALSERFPACLGRVRLLRPEIPDPFGGDDEDYERCAVSLLAAFKNAGIGC